MNTHEGPTGAPQGGAPQNLGAEAITCELTTKNVGLLHRTWLSLGWSCATPTNWDWVGLWDHEPVNADGYLASDWTYGHPHGSFVTSEEFDRSKTYWMAYCRRDSGDKILCKQRFMWHPHWMADLGEKIERKKLRELVLPASHDAATYGITSDSDMSPDLSGLRWMDIVENPIFGMLAFLGIKTAKGFIAAWAKTQVMNVAQQLDAGYRVFDLRVVKSHGDFWIFHGMYSVKLTEVLDAVRTFSMRNQHEIVLVVLSLLRMDSEDPAALLKLLKESLGRALAQNSLGRDAAVQDFWTARTPIAIIYNEINKQGNELPDPITDSILWKRSDNLITPYSSDDFDSADHVIAWLEKNVIPTSYDRFWDLPLILTLKSDAGEAINKTLRYGGLAGWTSETAVSPFTNFYERQTRKLNAIAVDYVNFYQLVSWAIAKNAETQQPKTRQAAQGGLVR